MGVARRLRATKQVEVARLTGGPDHASTIDLLKIDVEGAELELLLGIDGRQWSTIAHIVGEAQDVGG
ncbi:FkbM family methyltransferase [Streptomyces niveus]|uniref:FkbM family methyltransferase n=1 Tax=Streptomyces niveus TaxID=193462 RepID=UPI001495B159|nr:FkbM family methyltransferase [Streptomyces niveus]